MSRYAHVVAAVLLLEGELAVVTTERILDLGLELSWVWTGLVVRKLGCDFGSGAKVRLSCPSTGLLACRFLRLARSLYYLATFYTNSRSRFTHDRRLSLLIWRVSEEIAVISACFSVVHQLSMR